MLGALRLKVVTHVVLFLLITAQDTNLFNVAVQEAPENGVSEGSRASGDMKDFVFENWHILLLFDYCF